ncbi:hypothetical protein [Vitiosangium sp. GDMCC 1.1324]|uniref:hypothetical protein n=1 Tax=Vitiosangium sp. (strain GDMCC 1.1324) TaxID=2138576 RepID=UPI000D3B055D|nr:hypothetical protein [Vitiosangium sp. GDMCC 1.1324]PTL83443.1 hypothetical protein DAT35_15845 [Vitiosangium sp. GDMCC 1.1324]
MARSYVRHSLRIGGVLLGALAVMGFRMAFTPELPEDGPSASEPRPPTSALAQQQPEPRPVPASLGRTPAPAPRPERGPGALPPRTPQPRDPNEWQGMQVDLAVRALCGEANHCGLAAACTDGHCGPCATDADCDSGEACVLDHCVRQENVECHSRRDCPGEQLCALTGYSSDPRGNAQMRAYCLDPREGTPRPAEPTRPAPADPSQPREPVVYEELQRRLSSGEP